MHPGRIARRALESWPTCSISRDFCRSAHLAGGLVYVLPASLPARPAASAASTHCGGRAGALREHAGANPGQRLAQ